MRWKLCWQILGLDMKVCLRLRLQSSDRRGGPLQKCGGCQLCKLYRWEVKRSCRFKFRALTSVIGYTK